MQKLVPDTIGPIERFEDEKEKTTLEQDFYRITNVLNLRQNSILYCIEFK